MLNKISILTLIDGRLGVWDTAGLRGPYVLRLTATDRLGHFSRFVYDGAYLVLVQAGGQLHGVNIYERP
jgi:hypothetical protein